MSNAHVHDRTNIRIFPLYRSEDNHIYVLGGKEGFTIPATSRLHPSLSVEKHMQELGVKKEDIDVIHSTSWTYNNDTDKLTLNYTVIFDKPPHLVGEKIPENFTQFSKPPLDHELALLQALRHMSFLEKHDEAIRKVLKNGWENALSQYNPAVFIGRSTDNDKNYSPLNSIMVETLPFYINKGTVELAVGKDGTLKDKLPNRLGPEQFAREIAANMGKVSKLQPTSWREDDKGNLILTFAALLESQPILQPNDKTISVPPHAIAIGSPLSPPPNISVEELANHALRTVAEGSVKETLSHAWRTALRPYVEAANAKEAGNISSRQRS